MPVGIDSAQSASVMPVETPDFAAANRLAPAPAAAAPATPGSPPAEASPAAGSARLAVDAIVKLVDAQTGRSQAPVSAVSLNFKFGADDLAIRVEWRNGEVHTQFRTDSGDLRAALATQWQAMAPSTPGRTAAFAAPVFSSNGDQSASTAGGGPDARQYGQPESSAQSDQSGGTRMQRQTAAAQKASSPPAAAASIPALPTALRLHTFA
jgi:hypothetical protein